MSKEFSQQPSNNDPATLQEKGEADDKSRLKPEDVLLSRMYVDKFSVLFYGSS